MSGNDGTAVIGLIAIFSALAILLTGARARAQAQIALEQEELKPVDELQHQAIKHLAGPGTVLIAILVIIALAYAGNSLGFVR